MSRSSSAVDPRLAAYLHALASRREDPLLSELRTLTSDLPEGEMQIAVEQGLFMGLLVKLLGAVRCLFGM